MIGTSIPQVVIIVAICACNALGGLYGIAIAAVGVSTLAITPATMLTALSLIMPVVSQR